MNVYNAYGNVTGNGHNTFLYDDAANLRSVGGAATAQYDYDGHHLRVHQQKDGKDIYSVTLRNGRLLGEYNAQGTWLKEYAYLNDKLVTLALNPDSDQDGIPDRNDNCTQVANPDQRDTNNDGYGNLCDADFNNDNLTNPLDTILFRAGYNSILGSPTYNPDIDLNGDGQINTLDRYLFTPRYSKAPGPGATPAPEQLSYYHLDVLGSPVAATDEQGNLAWKETYQPYGERVQKQPGASNNTRWYTGHVLDPETGLQYAGARYYDPVVGRFMGVDPKEFTEANPHSFNRYNYANNNPYKYVDPDGREAYLIGHVAADPAGRITSPTSYHLGILLAPRDPTTLGGIKSYTLGGQPENGKLVSAPNYPGDAPANTKTLIKINAPSGQSDKEFLRNLVKASDSYKDDLKYSLPTDLGGTMPPGTYNSNSYASGVIKATGATPPALPEKRNWQAPGYTNPIPLPYLK